MAMRIWLSTMLVNCFSQTLASKTLAEGRRAAAIEQDDVDPLMLVLDGTDQSGDAVVVGEIGAEGRADVACGLDRAPCRIQGRLPSSDQDDLGAFRRERFGNAETEALASAENKCPPSLKICTYQAKAPPGSTA